MINRYAELVQPGIYYPIYQPIFQSSRSPPTPQPPPRPTKPQQQSQNSQQRNYQYVAPVKQGINPAFLQHIKSVKASIAILKENNKKMEDLKTKCEHAIKSAQQHKNSEQINAILSKNQQLHLFIQDKMKDVNKLVADAQSSQPNQPQTRMMRLYNTSVRRQIGFVLQEQQIRQQQCQAVIRNRVKRHIKNIQPSINEEQLKDYINHPEKATQMLAKKVFNQPSNSLKNAFSDIQDRFRDIKKLESSVMQCMAMFQQLAALVQSQGEKIDSIANSVRNAKDYTGKADQNLTKAKEHEKCSKKCLCIGVVVGLIILVVVVIIIFATKK